MRPWDFFVRHAVLVFTIWRDRVATQSNNENMSHFILLWDVLLRQKTKIGTSLPSPSSDCWFFIDVSSSGSIKMAIWGGGGGGGGFLTKSDTHTHTDRQHPRIKGSTKNRQHTTREPPTNNGITRATPMATPLVVISNGVEIEWHQVVPGVLFFHVFNTCSGVGTTHH